MSDFYTFIKNKLKQKKEKENFIQIHIDDNFYYKNYNVEKNSDSECDEKVAIIEII